MRPAVSGQFSVGIASVGGRFVACFTVLVHDRQPLQRAARGRPIEDEIPTPNVVLVRRAALLATVFSHS